MKLLPIFFLLLFYGCQDSGYQIVEEPCNSEIGCKAVTSSKTEFALPFDSSATLNWYGTLVHDSSAYISGSTVLAGNEDSFLLKIDMISNSLDSDFATNGVYNPTEASIQVFGGVHVFDNNVYAIGRSDARTSGVRSHDVLLSRLDNSTGALDTTFNSTGSLVQNYLGDWWDSGVETVEIGNKIYTCGMAWHSSTRRYDAFISRYEMDGTLDTSFGASGHVYIDFGVGQYERCFKVFELDSGKFLVVGGYQVVGKGIHNFMARYNSDWTIDLSFGNSGYSKIETSFYQFHSYTINSEIIGNELFLIGTSSVLSTDPSVATVMKVNLSDGQVITDFGDSGILKMDGLCASGPSSLYGVIDSFGSNTLLLRGECNDSGAGFILPITKTGKRVPEFNNGQGIFHLETDGVTKARIIGKYKTGSSYKIFALGANKIIVYNLKW